jgi:hypothetical protein
MAPSLPANIRIPHTNVRALSDAASDGIMALLIGAPVLLMMILVVIVLLVCRNASRHVLSAEESIHTHSSIVSFGSDPFSRLRPGQRASTSHTIRRVTSISIEVCLPKLLVRALLTFTHGRIARITIAGVRSTERFPLVTSFLLMTAIRGALSAKERAM